MASFTWSFSNLDLYETCGKKYYHLRVAKDIKDTGNAMSNYGFEAHKHFEDRMMHNKILPLDLKHHEPFLAKLEAAPGVRLGEQKLALTREFETTGFFDSDVWLRGIVDYTKFNGKHIIVVDYKFGKMKDSFDQLDLMVAVLFAYMPELETATGMFYWAKDKKITSKKYTRDDTIDIWARFMARVAVMEAAFKTTNFPAKPNYLCKNYCPVKSCPHCGV